MCGYQYPYPYQTNQNDGFNGWWAIFVVIIIIFFLFWGFNSNGCSNGNNR